MTDPLDDFPMPQAHVFIKPPTSGQANFYVEYHRLPEGVHTLIVTTSSPRPVTLYLASLMANSSRVKVGEIPAGTGFRSVVISGVGVAQGERRYLTISGAPSTVDDRATLQIITTPLTV